ncbi:MAG: hypothetical protein JSV24_00365 [Bacteroidales bacterium]|nr:MAG: hypothetical protein JSV24_00365 [Bacteroidales bacterium]
MRSWIFILAVSYLVLLVLLSLNSRRRNQTADDFIFAGSNIGIFLGLLTFAATLFSTFTLLGMPDFFRMHGIGAWIFLAVSDGAMVFLIVWFGYHLRKRVLKKGFRGMAGLLNESYRTSFAGYTYFAGVFLFLIPYVAIQIRGVAIFLNASFPEVFPVWGWALLIVITMLIYSEVGGLRAIMYADTLQGLILLVVVWVIAFNCISYFGGVKTMFVSVESVDPGLLSVPGPENLFNIQFLLASFLAILLLPVTQPQLTTRLVVMSNLRAMHRMAVGVGFFAIMIILPTAAIGLYGAVRYPEETTAVFLSQVLLFDQPGIVAAAAIIGLIAAALSTSDSQIFALGSELRSLLPLREKNTLLKTRIGMIVFGFASFVFSILSSDQLVLLARVSFAGTSLLAPMIFAAIFLKKSPGIEIVIATLTGLLLFIATLFNIIPSEIGTIRMDLLLLIFLGLFTVVIHFVRNRSNGWSRNQH